MLRNELFRFIAYRLEGKGWDDIPTIYGITQKFYPQSYNRIKSLVDNGASKEMIDDAIMDAYNQIYEKSGAGKLWHPLNWVYFDFYFNAGLNAAIVLQETINDFIGYETITVDGVIGSKTLKALNEFKGNLAFIGFYILNRIKFYMNTNNKKYINGWINRTIKLAKYIYREVS